MDDNFVNEKDIGNNPYFEFTENNIKALTEGESK